MSKIRSVAIIEPLGDFGIGAYAFELAEGLGANGVAVDLYTHGLAIKHAPSLHHRVLPVLGSMLFRQQDVIKENRHKAVPEPVSGSAGLVPAGAQENGGNPPFRSVRDFLATVELALHLKRSRYDLIWTQWPTLGNYSQQFWRICKLLGLRVIHTVHNVLPHETSPDDLRICGNVYRYSHRLVVHSNYTRDEIAVVFPGVAGKVIVAHHGCYTLYPRLPDARGRLRRELGIAAGQPALLFFGGVRPYKNIDAVLAALKDDRCNNMVLIVCGEESHFPDLAPGDKLGRTRRIAQELGIPNRVRLIPGLLDVTRLAEILEAADIVILPYLKHYGSGALLLGMTFGKCIVATATGGMEEYLSRYPRAIVLAQPEPSEVLRGILEAAQASSIRPEFPVHIPPEFDWRNIAAEMLKSLETEIM